MILTQEEAFRSCKRYLHSHICYVTFTKKDGTERVMKCTLDELRVPKYEQKLEESRTKTPNDDVCPVFDLEANAWRSFRWDSVKNFTIQWDSENE